MEKFIKKNWFRIIIVLIFGIYLISSLPKTKQVNISNQQNCSVMAEKYFNKNYINSSGVTNNTYVNHFNKKLNNCFILVSYFDAESGFGHADLYDALENKHYGAFVGHRFCDTKTNECGDSGAIWLDGNDTLPPTDGAESYKEFTEKIKPFMND